MGNVGTIEGTAWNDIKVKSLTSEYSDYLQFYRKNRELSEERKEKLKYQIQRVEIIAEKYSLLIMRPGLTMNLEVQLN